MIMDISFESHVAGTWILTAADGRTILVQTDWDYPGLASTFGWVPCRQCNATDGTVDCEHRTASEMICEASQWLADHEGKSVEDPGYFDSED